ncbi:MAG: aminopeptidase family protein P [Myxococcota bacterium]
MAWLFNLRGGDLPHTPAFLGYAIVTEATLSLFVDERKVTAAVRAHLDGVDIRPLREFPVALSNLDGRALVDEVMTPVAVVDCLSAPLLRRDPVALPKARKNATELQGSRAAHRRDGAAVTQFLHWLEGEAAGGQLGELTAAAKLLEFRRQNERYEDLSFETITGAGPNGAVIHYRATPRSERILERNSIYLVDSGAQYLDGTTDITRTVVVGEATEEQKDRFTRVLKGHIAIARAVFPKGATGSQIDVLARQALWEAGLDYDHGTGHGVGSYLGVHEGPQRIANRPNTVALEPGMICSNEPGYYKPGAYGIRIENLVVVTKAEEIPGAEREMLGFETLTLAPIERRLIEPSLLTAAERRWLNTYHARVCEQLAPLVDHETAKWLREVTREIE